MALEALAHLDAKTTLRVSQKLEESPLVVCGAAPHWPCEVQDDDGAQVAVVWAKGDVQDKGSTRDCLPVGQRPTGLIQPRA
jgi:hypothetical protein